MDSNTDYFFDDIVLAAALSEAMRRSRLHPGALVNVSNAEVTLEGEVDTEREREDAESLVRQFLGVRQVVNSLTVKSASTDAE